MLLYNYRKRQTHRKRERQIMTNITRENALEVLKESEFTLKQVANHHDYDFNDLAEMCQSLSDLASTSLVVNEIDSEKYPNNKFNLHIQDNLQTVASLLDVCARLLNNCYYDFS